jgi:ribulose-5-phosphate 4-epimerase/fuculose-1-phosphate aldolase
MKQYAPVGVPAELRPLLEFTQRVGSDPLLTQASNGNISTKLDGLLWIKASGRWMADALRDEILIPLDLAEATDCLRRGIDPTERYPRASLETAMHAALPHRVVLHVHCVNTISWAVRNDAPMHLQSRLDVLHWQWLPYAPSGLPLSREIRRALSVRPDTNIFVLGNHGLVLAGEDAETVEALLRDVQRRLAIMPRPTPPADSALLLEICSEAPWNLPDDDGLHIFGTDVISKTILAKGILHPCQASLYGQRAPGLFRPIYYPAHRLQSRYCDRPFLVIHGKGVVVSGSMAPSELATLSGLAQVVQRLSASTPLRYLTESEVAGLGH